jgi:hypothetical protein
MKDQLFELYLVNGFILQTKAAGWNLVCERLGITPFGLRQYIPGFERLQRALKIVEGAPDRPGPVITRASMVKWTNRARSDGEPDWTDADIIAPEKIADQIDVAFRERARRGGAD